MAELDIGLHCSIPECHQLDFLPFECDGCSRIFCLKHKERTAHDCSDVNYHKENPVDSHIIGHACSILNCEKSELVPVSCSQCNQQFCLNHRLPEDHECPSLVKSKNNKTTVLKLEVQKETRLHPKPHNKPVNPKNKKLAARVALMKLKQKALGNKELPMGSRVFFLVKTPSQCQEVSIFVAEEWTFGQLLDEVAKISNLRNINNITLENRLVMRNFDSDAVLDLSMKIRDAIISDLVFSGSTLEIYHANGN